MFTLIMSAWLMLPMAPINPIEQDTLSAINLHITAGMSGSGGNISPGPEISAKWEMLAIHPILIRSSIDYRYGEFSDRFFEYQQNIGKFKGQLHQFNISTDFIYYRGTDYMTGYIGLGPILTLGDIKPTVASLDDFREMYDYVDFSLKPKVGYRITLGLRYQQVYSLELVITEVHPDYLITTSTGTNSYLQRTREVNFSGIKVTFGYLFTLLDIW